jgi:hypothetical protein
MMLVFKLSATFAGVSKGILNIKLARAPASEARMRHLIEGLQCCKPTSKRLFIHQDPVFAKATFGHQVQAFFVKAKTMGKAPDAAGAQPMASRGTLFGRSGPGLSQECQQQNQAYCQYYNYPDVTAKYTGEQSNLWRTIPATLCTWRSRVTCLTTPPWPHQHQQQPERTLQ